MSHEPTAGTALGEFWIECSCKWTTPRQPALGDAFVLWGQHVETEKFNRMLKATYSTEVADV